MSALDPAHLTIALVGRPNVGKSTLFNRLIGKRLALVDDRPGVTRDRREGEARLADLRFTIIDTAGVEDADAESLTGRMRAQTLAAVESADGAIFMVDARAGILPAEAELADLLRRSGRPVVVVANKAEGRAGDQGAMEAYALGLGEPVALSAEHGVGMVDLRDALAAALPALLEEGAEEAEDERDPEEGIDPSKPLRVAVVGRPNAGKSTLINTLLGTERLLVGPEAGITRDAIGLDWSWRGRPFKLFDTAGLRKRARVQDKLEKLANTDAIRAVQFAEVVVLLLDATIALEKQDLTLADLIEREGRALVIALNKWDLVANPGTQLALLREEATRLLPQVRGVAVVPVAGITGTGLDRMLAAVVKAHEVWNTRVPTAALNRWLAAVRDRHPPPAVSGRRIKLRYATQAKARPPHIVVFGTQLDALPKSYSRYLVNDLRDSFELPGTPIRLSLREPENPYDKG